MGDIFRRLALTLGKASMYIAVGSGAIYLGIGNLKSYWFSTYTEEKSLHNKQVLITGGTSGIGLAVAKDLAKRGATVLLACRDQQKCNLVSGHIKWQQRSARVKCLELDLTSHQSVRSFVTQLGESSEASDKLDLVILSAGIMEMSPKPKLTADNVELNLGVNYLSNYLLTQLLLANNMLANDSRIVFVTCAKAFSAKLDWQQVTDFKRFSADNAYSVSKLFQLIYMRNLHLMLRERGSKICTNAADPGSTDTDYYKSMQYHNFFFSSFLFAFWNFLTFKFPFQGAATVLKAAVSDELEGVSGQLLQEMEVAEIPEDVEQLMKDNAQQLSRLSEQCLP